MTTTDGAAAMQRLVDESLLRDLVARFALALDERRWDDYAALYAEDAVLRLPHGEVRGRAAIRDWVGADLGRYTATHHAGGHLVVDVDGDTARLRTTLLGTHVEGSDPQVHWAGGGWYHLGLRRSGEGWEITSTQVVPSWLRLAPGARGPLPPPGPPASEPAGPGTSGA